MEISLGEMLSAALGGCPEDGFAPPTPSPFNPYQLCQANFRQPNRNYNPAGSCAFNVGLQSHNSAPARVAIPAGAEKQGAEASVLPQGAKAATAKGYKDRFGLESRRTKKDRNNPDAAPKKKRVRNKVPNPDEWQVNIRKKACRAGEEYISRRGKKVGPKVVISLKDCLANCQYRCAKHVSEEKRREINRAYYSLKSQTQKRDFLIHTTIRCLTKRPKKFNPGPKGRPCKDPKKKEERERAKREREKRKEKRLKEKKEKEKKKKERLLTKLKLVKKAKGRKTRGRRRKCADTTDSEEEESEMEIEILSEEEKETKKRGRDKGKDKGKGKAKGGLKVKIVKDKGKGKKGNKKKGKDKDEEVYDVEEVEKEKDKEEEKDKSKDKEEEKDTNEDKEEESNKDKDKEKDNESVTIDVSAKTIPQNESSLSNMPNDLSKTNALNGTNNSNIMNETNRTTPLNELQQNNALNVSNQHRAMAEAIQNNPYDLHKNHPFSDLPQNNPFDLHRNPFDLHRNPFDIHRHHPFGDLHRNMPFNMSNNNPNNPMHGSNNSPLNVSMNNNTQNNPLNVSMNSNSQNNPLNVSNNSNNPNHPLNVSMNNNSQNNPLNISNNSNASNNPLNDPNKSNDANASNPSTDANKTNPNDEASTSNAGNDANKSTTDGDKTNPDDPKKDEPPIRVSRRKYTFKYFFYVNEQKVQVCKAFYLGTLNISQSPIYSAHESKNPITNTATEDMRGKNPNCRRKPDGNKDYAREHIRSFPTVKSHCCVASKKMKYLDGHLSVAKMFDLYLQKCIENRIDPVRKSMYHHIFSTEFNLSFLKPPSSKGHKCHS